MARPASHEDIPSFYKTRRIASVNLNEFAHDPRAVAAYSALLSALQKIGAVADVRGASVDIDYPLSNSELDAELERRQTEWDRNMKRYHAVSVAVRDGGLPTLEPSWADHETLSLRVWAVNNDRPVFDLIHPDAEVRKAAREAAGLRSK